MTTKRIATAYLPSGKEIKFVFDTAICEESYTAYSLNKKEVSIIPYSVPIIFEDWKEKPQYDSEKLKEAFEDYSKSPMQPSPEPNDQGAKWTTIDEYVKNIHKEVAKEAYENHQKNTALEEAISKAIFQHSEDKKNIIDTYNRNSEIHTMD